MRKYESGSSEVWTVPFRWVEDPLIDTGFGARRLSGQWALLYPQSEPDRLVDHVDNTKDLFLRFAELNSRSSEEMRSKILDFVSLYGPLGGRFREDRFLDPDSERTLDGEYLLRWQIEVENFWATLSTWELVREGKRAALTNIFRWLEDRIVFVAPTQTLILSSRNDRPEGFSRISKMGRGKVEATAWDFISVQLDIGLSGSTALGTTVGQVGQKPTTSVKAFGTLGAAWVQLARAIESGTPPSQCVVCKRRFVGRADKKTCSPRCRQQKRRKKV